MEDINTHKHDVFILYYNSRPVSSLFYTTKRNFNLFICEQKKDDISLSKVTIIRLNIDEIEL